jgi:hypothetical protein
MVRRVPRTTERLGERYSGEQGVDREREEELGGFSWEEQGLDRSYL